MKRIFAAWLAVCLLAGVLGLAAFAENEMPGAGIAGGETEQQTAPEGWDGATDADYNKEEATPVAVSEEPSEIIPNASSGGTWVQSSNGKWWYRYDDGTYPANTWAYINGYWYHFDSDGWMQTGWLKLSGKWYYLWPSGYMATGWNEIGGYWYYFWPSGYMATGWNEISYSGGTAWFYFYSNGHMATGTVTLAATDNTPDRTAYFSSNGVWLYTTSLLTWDLMGSDNKLSIYVNTKYSAAVTTAMNTWCEYKSGIIYKTSSKSSADVTLIDVDSLSGQAVAETSSDAKEIRFNRSKMQTTITAPKNINACLHELGHGLGLHHNDSGDVMYYRVSTVTALQTNDKRSLDASLAN